MTVDFTAGTDVTDSYETLMQFLYRAPVGLVQTTADGAIEMINPMSANLLLPLSDAGHLDNLFTALAGVAPQLTQLVRDFNQPSGSICESLRIELHADMHYRTPKWLSLSLVKLDAGRLIAMLSDVTFDVQREQRSLTRQRLAAARIDGLTEMPTRSVACERLQQAIGRTPPEPGCDPAVLFINFDRFNHINDTWGHAAGDEVLRIASERLRSVLRQYNRSNAAPGRESLPAAESLAARVGGDEFVVILGDLHFTDDLHSVAQRLINVLTLPYGIGTLEVYCGVSMGIVLRPQMRVDADMVLQDATTAMVEAKRAGGTRYVVFEPAMQERAARRHAIEIELRRAIVEEELFVVYQPVVGLQGPAIDRAAGVEALVRWRHPSRGVVPPLEFITVAEECGLIGVIGDYVLDRACRQFVQWQNELGPRAPRLLAVNLSRSQLGLVGFVSSVEHILRCTRMVPTCLQLEVTESLAAQDETVREVLQELKALGLTLALDDFGTGYSSLSSLHQLPVDTIKIDRSFVGEAVTSAHHRVLIEATVRVAKSLRMGTVAEGIETQDQARVVRDLGCEKGQGYFFSKPLEADDLVSWLLTQQELVARA